MSPPGQPVPVDPTYLDRLARTRMPFGRYVGRLLIDLPEPYVVWFRRQGFPRGELGDMLNTVYEVKLNGLEHLVRERLRRPRT
ncbi:MAG: DUF3820 family protein [Pseudomonadota bacterium]